MSALAGKRVLVVEDDSLLAFDLATFLEDEGYVVLGPATTVDAALALIAAERPDAAVLDLDLGGQNSAPIADTLATSNVGFVFISGHSRTMLPAAHADRPILSKPWTEVDLRSALAGMLD